LLPGSGTAQSMQDGARAGKDLEAGNYGVRHFISARALSTPASIGCLRENNWRFLVGWPPRLFRGRSLRLQRPWRRPVNRLMKFGVRPVLSVAQTIFGGSRSLTGVIG